MEGFPPPKNNRVTIDNYRAKLKGLENQNPGAAVAKTRWAHFHMRELFPTQRISRGRIPIRPLPVKVVDLSEVRVPTGEESSRSISEWLDQSYTDAFLVLHNGSIVREEYFHGMRDDTHHHLWSLGKSFVAGVVFHLIAEGKLKEDGLITDYVPELKKTGYKGATVRHLLDMRSGVGFDYESVGEKGTWPGWARAAGLSRKLSDEPTDEGLYDFMMKSADIRRQARPHGSYLYYKESDVQALVWACEKVTGTRFSDLLGQRIWSRLGMEHDAYVINDSVGTALPWAGMSATLRDLGRWGQSYLSPVANNPAIPRSLINDAPNNYDLARAAITEDSFIGPRHDLPANAAYRSLHWIHRYANEDLVSAAGNYGQVCAIFPQRKLVFVKLSTYNFSTLQELLALEEMDRDAFRAIADALSGKAKRY